MTVRVGESDCYRCGADFDVLLSGPAVAQPGRALVTSFEVDDQFGAIRVVRCPHCGQTQAIPGKWLSGA